MSGKGRVGPRPNADTWKGDRQLPILHRIFASAGLLAPSVDEVYKPAPGEKVPVFRELNQALFLLPLALVPFMSRWLYYHYVDHVMPDAMTTWFFVLLYMSGFASFTVLYLNRLVRKYGYLDGNVGRDTIPFSLMPKVAFEVAFVTAIRPALVVLACYDPKEKPQLSFWLPLQLFLLTITEDFYYYWFHRLCHEAEACWRFHRLHHTTKHPTSMLLGYADEIQELFDIVGAPMISWLTCPFSFDVTIIWMIIHIHLQIGGHSGMRLHTGSVLTGPYLRPFGMELVVEDHDLHHRHGWKDSYNYGKQSRLWDTLHGTKGNRVEGCDENLNWNKFVSP